MSVIWEKLRQLEGDMIHETDVQRVRGDQPESFWRGVRNGILFAIPIWGLMILAIHMAWHWVKP